MRKQIFALALVFVLVFALSASVNAEGLRIATGKETGIYYSVAGKLLQQQLGNTKSELISTNGSVQNLEMLKNGTADIAFCQLDALINMTGADMDILIIKRLYPEYVHLIVSQGSKIKSIKDFDLKKAKFAIGPDGSGTWVTWKSFCTADKSYADVATVPLGGARALSALESKDVDAVLLIGGLGMGDAMKANNDGAKFELAAVDDWDFNNAVYKKDKVYDFIDLPAKTYPMLIEGMFKGSVETIKVDAVLVTTAKWADANANLYDKLFDAATRTIPNIKLAMDARAKR